MSILSIDVGMKHLAYCVLKNNDGDDNYIIQDWNVIDLCNQTKPPKCMNQTKKCTKDLESMISPRLVLINKEFFLNPDKVFLLNIWKVLSFNDACIETISDFEISEERELIFLNFSEALTSLSKKITFIPKILA